MGAAPGDRPNRPSRLARWWRCPIRKRHSLFLFLYQFIILSFCVLFSFIFFKINFYLFKVPLNVYLFPCLPLPLKLHFCHTLHKINLVLFLFQGRIKPVMPRCLCRPFRISWCFNYYILFIYLFFNFEEQKTILEDGCRIGPTFLKYLKLGYFPWALDSKNGMIITIWRYKLLKII